ncbi:hypothetical protein Cni_G06213 [Canna indica]|uniref:Uncharacterized protein n=1 Tax=Canna indica TaxID=4628 RepID=A0AAQ3K112_9LILI|nr:hypothetical protein Cni_G06213 [Canna indica]
MERLLLEHDRECMKTMMLKHEETFKQQVRELHRLYRLQKLLMRDMENGERNNAQRRWRPRRVLNLELPADEYIEKAEEEQESEIELTLTIGSRNSDSGASSSSTESGGGLKLNGNGWELQQEEDVNTGNQFKLGRKREGRLHLQCLSLKMV